MESILLIWLILLLAIGFAVTGFAWPRDGGAYLPAGETDGDRFAAGVAEAAERAAADARRCREQWEHGRAGVAAAWAAFEEADERARRSTAAAAFPALVKRRRPTLAERERHLHRIATAACRRKEISIEQLADALAHRGWDPRREPAAQEAALHRAVRDHRLALYRQAAAREQIAWEAAERSADALCALRAEALAARSDRYAEHCVTTQPLPVIAGLASTVEGRHPIVA